VRLCQHPDFRDLLIGAAQARGIPEQFVEKDYYVTEALRIVATDFPREVIFKGGTSLSKGWNLIQRFSEDIDLFLNPRAFTPELSKRAIDRELKRLRDAVATHPGLTYQPPDNSNTIGGFSRSDEFVYTTRFGELAILRSALLLEAGIQSGEQPTEDVELSSYVADFLRSRDLDGIAEDIASFRMTLLHFRRTFIEKMFAIHSKVVAETGGDGTGEIGRHMRHYADLCILATHPEVVAMLGTAEDQEIRRDYNVRSLQFFSRSHHPPADLRFSHSPALFPPEELRRSLAVEYERQCGKLFIGPGRPPAFAEVLAAFEKIRHLL
jgi:hypothetical protein